MSKIKFLQVVPVVAIVGLLAAGWLNRQAAIDLVGTAQKADKQEAMNSQYDRVTRVVDGDTIELAKLGKVRLCGIDAPEKSQPLGNESKAALAQMVEGKEVAVMVVDKDRYGRSVAEVFVPTGQDAEVHVNGELVQMGMAYYYQQYADKCPNQALLAGAEAQAKTRKAGVWSRKDAVKPWEYRKAVS
ncbi:thermonuclease family protein [Alkalinema pantanalense CENA528]|uniref:thermonuclease family protein n=1 Tax=Alkalinema pantanalense TaxID=1620705 RepID=UPI003D6F7814